MKGRVTYPEKPRGGPRSKVDTRGGVMSVVELGDRVNFEIQQASVTTSKAE